MKLGIALAAIAAVLGASPAPAQDYPTRTVRLIVPFPPGGGQDVVARQLAPHLAKGLGQPVVVDNRPGGGATIGTAHAAAAAPDGYTVFMASNTTHAINPNLHDRLAYDPIKSFAAVGQIATLPNILVVNPSMPARNIAELVTLAKSRQGQMNFSSAGSGTPSQLAGVMFNQAAGLNLVHIPYKGAGPALTSVLSGETQMMFGTITSSISFVRTQQLRALAVTGAQRSSAAPDVPTIAESGYAGYEATTWYGLAVPARTPKAIIARLNTELVRALNSREFKTSLVDAGAEPVGSSPAAFAAHIKAELVKYTDIVKKSGMVRE